MYLIIIYEINMKIRKIISYIYKINRDKMYII